LRKPQRTILQPLLTAVHEPSPAIRSRTSSCPVGIRSTRIFFLHLIAWRQRSPFSIRSMKSGAVILRNVSLLVVSEARRFLVLVWISLPMSLKKLTRRFFRQGRERTPPHSVLVIFFVGRSEFKIPLSRNNSRAIGHVPDPTEHTLRSS
jgi:hypothetical protein